MRLDKCQLSLFNFGLKTKSPEKKGENTINPMKVFPVPGGPWITANSLVSASCKALNCESSNFRSSATGQEAGSNTETNSPAW